MKMLLYLIKLNYSASIKIKLALAFPCRQKLIFKPHVKTFTLHLHYVNKATVAKRQLCP